MEMAMAVEAISPAKAAEYLRHNSNNYRKLSRTKVKLYADDMAAGRWQLNGEAIIFGEDGVLKDGQHRLAGIVASGKTVQMAVIRGVDKDVSIYDIGSNRTLVNIAGAGGLELTKVSLAAAKLIVSGYNREIAKGEVLEYARTHQADLARAEKICKATSGERFSRKASCVAATYLLLVLEKIPVYEFEVFWRIFNSGNTVGADGYESSPALVARRMFDARRGKIASNTLQKEQTEIILKAVLDFHSKTVRQANYRVSEPLTLEEMLERLSKKEAAK